MKFNPFNPGSWPKWFRIFYAVSSVIVGIVMSIVFYVMLSSHPGMGQFRIFMIFWMGLITVGNVALAFEKTPWQKWNRKIADRNAEQKLSDVRRLYDKGIISAEEYEAGREEILSGTQRR